MRNAQAWRAALVGTGMVVAAGIASAQSTPVMPQPKDPNLPAPQNTLPEKIAPRSGDTTGSTGNLSDRLQQSDGVIKPGDTGTVRTITPPDVGTTPVIPPPGSPGSSNQDVQPK